MLIIVLVVLLTWYVFFSLRNWTLPLQRLEESSHEFVHVNVKSSHALCRKSSLTSTCFFFGLGVKILGRNFAAMQCKFKFDVKIPWTDSNKSLPPFQFWHTFCSTSFNIFRDCCHGGLSWLHVIFLWSTTSFKMGIPLKTFHPPHWFTAVGFIKHF